MTSFREMKQDAPDRPDVYVSPCQICRKITQNKTLMERGGMCQGCFDSYCQGARQNRIGLDANRRQP